VFIFDRTHSTAGLWSTPNEMTAWSGSRFVPITEDGLPASDVQVSNLDTREDAAEYAASFAFEVVAPTIH
jgi:hypothetical protein